MNRGLAKIVAITAILKVNKVAEFVQIVAAELRLKETLKKAHLEALEEVFDLLTTSAPAIEAADAFIARAGKVFTIVYAHRFEELVGKHIDHVYRLGKKAAVRRLSGKISGDFMYEFASVAKVDELPSFEIEFSFTLQDEKAIKQLMSGHFFWVEGHYDRKISDIIRRVITDTSLRAGLGRAEVGLALQRELRVELGRAGVLAPSGWRGGLDEYFRMVSAAVTTTARSASITKAVEEAGASYLVIVTAMDERVCPRCSMMHGKQFKIEQARAQLDALMGASSVDEVKKAQPWLTADEFKKIGGAGNISDLDSAKFAAAGVVLPPFHGGCRCSVDLAPGHEVE